MVLMAVLGAILLAMVIAAKMSEIGVDAQNLINYTSARENNYQVARSAVEMGFELLKADTGDTDSLNDMWAAGSVVVEWEGKKVVISIVDEESKFPLSAMQKAPNSCEYLENALVRLFENGGLGCGEEAKDRFLDWVDNDAQRRSRGGEGSDYETLVIKDAPADSLQEILALPGWQDRPAYASARPQSSLQSIMGSSSSLNSTELGATASSLDNSATDSNASNSNSGSTSFEKFGSEQESNDGSQEEKTYKLDVPGAQTQGGTAVTDWNEWVTVYSSGKININTAPKEVLLSLDESMSQVLVDEIDSKRRSSPFKTTDELRNITGMDADLLFRIQDYLCVKSNTFSIDAEVLSSPGRIRLHSVVSRADGSISILRWEVK
ncbi:MAG: general secretion pathway protein GspK [Candidatus Bruticola sp.]